MKVFNKLKSLVGRSDATPTTARKKLVTRKNLIKAAVVGAFMIGSAAAFTPTSTSADSGCDAHGVGNRTMTNNTNNTAYTIKNGKATVKFKVVGKNCKLPVSIIAWKAPNGTTGKPYSAQRMFAHDTKVFTTGTHTMTVDLPDCYFQVDTVTGRKLTGSTGQAWHYDSRQVAFMHGGTQTCNPKPSDTIDKQVSVKGKNQYSHQISVAPGTHVMYRVTATNTGNVALKNVALKDNLPATAKYVDNTLTLNGKAVDDSKFFTTGYTISSLAPKAKAVFKFEAIIGEKDTQQNCTEQQIDNVASVDSKGLQTKQSQAGVDKKCQPKPAVACNSLTATAGAVNQTTGVQTYSLKTVATATNANIVSYTYNFGDGTITTVPATTSPNTTSHSYAPGNYTASVTVNFTDKNGTAMSATSPYCKVPIKVNPLPEKVLTCDSLTATPGAVSTSTGNQAYSFVAKATAKNMPITSYVFNFGDGQSQTVTTGSTTANASHTYAPGTYTATVKVNGTVSGENCNVTVRVNPNECKPGVPAGSKECFDYTCKALTVTKGDDRSVTVASFSATSTNTNATPANTVIDWGDDSDATSAANIVGAQHQYEEDGSYTITATAHFTVDGKDVAVAGANCIQTVSYNTPETPETPDTPEEDVPEELPDTGAGQVIGLFAATAVVGTIGSRLFMARRSSRQ